MPDTLTTPNTTNAMAPPCDTEALTILQARLLYWDDIASAQWVALQQALEIVLELIAATPRQPAHQRQERSRLCIVADALMSMMPRAAERRAMLTIIRAETPEQVTPELMEQARLELSQAVRQAQLDGYDDVIDAVDEVFEMCGKECHEAIAASEAVPDSIPLDAVPPLSDYSVLVSPNPLLLQEMACQAQLRELQCFAVQVPHGPGIAIKCDADMARGIFEAAVEILTRRQNAHKN